MLKNNNYVGSQRGELVVPLIGKYHEKDIALPANARTPVPTIAYPTHELGYVIIRPELAKETDTKAKPVKPKQLNPLDFMHGGGDLLGNG
jgi:hypothetical protein